MKGKWRIVEMPDYEDDFPDMVKPAYILFDGKGGGEFAFGCVTGAIHGAGDTDAIEFTWDGNDEMDKACGEGWAELQPDGSIAGQICFHGGDEANFTALDCRGRVGAGFDVPVLREASREQRPGISLSEWRTHHLLLRSSEIAARRRARGTPDGFTRPGNFEGPIR